MLQHCAPGYTAKATDHFWCVRLPNGRTYPSLPKGEHGKKNPEIQVGHIKKMCRHLDILACAQAQISRLG